MGKPWDKWIPGALNPNQMRELCSETLIKGVSDLDKAISFSAIDLMLSDVAYRMTRGSVKPSSGCDSYEQFIKKEELGERIRASNSGTFTLEAKETYVFKLRESLDVRRLGKVGIYGTATAKSSVGRVDVLARLIVDGMDRYVRIRPRSFDWSCRMHVSGINAYYLFCEGKSWNPPKSVEAFLRQTFRCKDGG